MDIPPMETMGEADSVPKVDYRRYTADQRAYCQKLFLNTLQEFGLQDHGREFVADLLTESEIVMFARRIEIARRLLRGWSFDRVMEELHVGLCTVMSVDRWLATKLPAYREELCPRGRRSSPPPMSYTLTWFRKHYPRHWVLINILLGDV